MSEHEKVTRPSVHYRPGNTARRCGKCVMFHPDETNDAVGTCDILTGLVHVDFVCDRFERKIK